MNTNDNLFGINDNQKRHTLVIELRVYQNQERDCVQNMWTRRLEEELGEVGNWEKGLNEGFYC